LRCLHSFPTRRSSDLEQKLTLFSRHFGEGSNPYPTAGNSYCLGLCTGSFAAAAISTSQTLSELIPAGVEAVLTAFRTALRSLMRSEEHTSELQSRFDL